MNTTTPTKEEAPPIDPAFLQLMQQHRRGNCLCELSESLRELNKQVQLTGKGGSLTLKISVTPATSLKGAVTVRDEIRITAPKTDKGGSLFYASADGALLRDDPNQQHLELRTVQGGPTDGAVELRKVEA